MDIIKGFMGQTYNKIPEKHKNTEEKNSCQRPATRCWQDDSELIGQSSRLYATVCPLDVALVQHTGIV